jgi:hypothetical protein
VLFKADSGFISHRLESDTAFNFPISFHHLIALKPVLFSRPR